MLNKIYQYYKASGYRIQTDSRLIKEGDVFFALRGENFDGNEFAQTALDIGASAVIVDREVLTGNPKVIKVEDSLKTLQELSCFHKRKIGIKVIGIAGSNGKTTTKELLFAVLSQKYNVYKTPGNYNNQIGVPLTLLGIRPETELAIVELGTNHPGEIELLCQIAEPDFGLITNIGKEHLEGFGSLEAVAREESFLFLHLLQNNGFAFVNACEEYVLNMSERLNQKLVYGLKGRGDKGYEFEILNVVPNVEINWESNLKAFGIHSSLSGWHNAMNIVTAVAVGLYFNIPEQLISDAISNYVSKDQRSQWVQTKHNKVLLDAYNANPSSMEVTLQTLDAFEGEKTAILGDMFELGTHALEEHQTIVNLAERLSINKILLLGDVFAQCNLGKKTVLFKNHDELIEYLKTSDFKNQIILVKGSRGMAMEKVMDFL